MQRLSRVLGSTAPTSVKVHLIPRTEVLRRWEARRTAREAAGYTLGPGPSFIALYKSDDAGPGSGLGDEFEPIAEINIDELRADQPLAAADIQVVEGIAPPCAARCGTLAVTVSIASSKMWSTAPKSGFASIPQG